MIWVNFKLYKETFGDGALRLAEACRWVSGKTKVPIIPIVSPFDLWRIKKEIGGKVWLQHLDIYFEGPRTGWQSPLAAVALAADGVIINHAEHRLPPAQIRQLLAFCRRKSWQQHWQQEVGNKLARRLAKLKIMVCFGTKGQARHWVRRLDPRPDWLAYEPRQLIGGQIAVTVAQAATIKFFRQLLPQDKLVAGAGIKTAKDVRQARELGLRGVIVSSAVVAAKQPKKALLELAKGWQ